MIEAQVAFLEASNVVSFSDPIAHFLVRQTFSPNPNHEKFGEATQNMIYISSIYRESHFHSVNKKSV